MTTRRDFFRLSGLGVFSLAVFRKVWGSIFEVPEFKDSKLESLIKNLKPIGLKTRPAGWKKLKA